MKPKPWSKRWERPKFNVQGIRFDLCLTPEMMEHAQKWAQPWRKYDMLKEYETSNLEEQILQEVQENLSKWAVHIDLFQLCRENSDEEAWCQVSKWVSWDSKRGWIWWGMQVTIDFSIQLSTHFWFWCKPRNGSWDTEIKTLENCLVCNFQWERVLCTYSYSAAQNCLLLMLAYK